MTPDVPYAVANHRSLLLHFAAPSRVGRTLASNSDDLVLLFPFKPVRTRSLLYLRGVGWKSSAGLRSPIIDEAAFVFIVMDSARRESVDHLGGPAGFLVKLKSPNCNVLPINVPIRASRGNDRQRKIPTEVLTAHPTGVALPLPNPWLGPLQEPEFFKVIHELLKGAPGERDTILLFDPMQDDIERGGTIKLLGDEVLEFLKTTRPSADWIFNDDRCPRAGFLLGDDEIFPELYLYMKHCLFPWLGRNDY